MSGPHLVEQSSDAAAKPPAAGVHSEDYAASLRAAALLTLKSKRHRLTIDSSKPVLPLRPIVAAPSIQLDYGSEEPSGGVSSIASSPAIRPVASAAPVSEAMDVDYGQAREEGEISDSDMPPPSPPVKLNTVQELNSFKAPQPEPAIPMPPPPVLKLEPMSPALGFAPPSTSLRPSTSPPVDGTHYRPGLAMTEAQYLTARDTILDLLGWGVPPEYLVNCGLSREIIFYIFVEYNLRLPSNMDVTGLTPYVPPSSVPSAAASTSPSVLSRSNLLPKTAAQLSSSLSAAASPFVPGSNGASGSSPSTSLHDIEQQRKQELLARKAVQATRKLKQQKSTSSVDSQSSNVPAAHLASSKGDSSTSIAVPTKTVDDFLKSIEPVGPSSGEKKASSSSSASTTKPPSHSLSVDTMDVDEIPGLTGGFSGITDYTPIPRPVSTRSTTATNATSTKSPIIPPSAVSTTSDRSFYAPTGPSSGNTAFPYDDDIDAIPGLFQTRSPPDDTQHAGARRGVKRPVAADFVDMEPGPSRTQSRGVPVDQLRGMPRRKTTGFTGLHQRRCVIELSDTEDEPEDVPILNGVPPRTDSRGPNASTPQVSIAPTPRVNSPVAPSSATPAALLEKEEQIRRMRELIAQREQSRLKKLASVFRNTPTSSDTQNNGTPTIKREEDDSTAAQSLQPSRSHSSATPSPTPDPTVLLRPHERTEEELVFDALLPHEGDPAVVSLPSSESTSDAVTPIEVTSNTMEHPTTGDKVLTHEAQQEKVIDSPGEITDQSDDIEVDVVCSHPETSAQVATEIMNAGINDEQPEQTPGFETYRSLLDRHPLLRAHSRQDPNYVGFPASSFSALGGPLSSTTQATDIDLKPLKQTAVIKYLSDNARPVCQYELPGGGECRDKSCENVHLSRLSAVEPSDEDTAQYLYSSVPGGQRYGLEVFLKALNVARLSHPTMPFDARVQEALTRLGLR